MADRYVLDTSAVITFMQDEPGADTVRGLLQRARQETCSVFVSFITLTELYYIIWQEEGESAAKESVILFKSLPITMVESLERISLAAGRIKANARLSLADAFIAATAQAISGVLVHKDPELEQVKNLITTEPLPFKVKRKS